MPTDVPQKIASGSWSDEVSWEFYITSELPPRELCTAVFCLALYGNDNIVLTKTKRGWEMLGGHLEGDESLEQALFREAHEEGGYTPEEYTLLGYRKIISTRPIPARYGKMYPHPVSYIPLFIARSNLPIESVHGDEDEVLDSGVFTLSQMRSMNISSIEIINAALQYIKHESESLM